MAALVSRSLVATEQGFGMGTLSSINSLTNVFGPMIFAHVYSAGQGMGWSWAPFMLGGIMGTLASIVAAFFVPPIVKKSEEAMATK